ncbi:hypothetical protein ZPR_3970 [Zunongwangia profunda SM-A87]|uniref:Uncharacterized protein n=1 Tax=Zunongwangia profunda (strain DSM 18752 / CCTCC AB 206139 / SM-A87) TaxID=655815 RepID=D5B9G1_ZUNPS|nr:hypothetical protein ZPR_3970 [Zunongwangia profunda SM-A87]
MYQNRLALLVQWNQIKKRISILISLSIIAFSNTVIPAKFEVTE